MKKKFHEIFRTVFEKKKKIKNEKKNFTMTLDRIKTFPIVGKLPSCRKVALTRDYVTDRIRHVHFFFYWVKRLSRRRKIRTRNFAGSRLLGKESSELKKKIGRSFQPRFLSIAGILRIIIEVSNLDDNLFHGDEKEKNTL